MAKPKPNVTRKTKLQREPFLPARSLPAKPVPRAGFATYYLSCTRRSFGAYTALAEKQWQGGFRGVLLAPVGLVFEPAEALVGYQPGDCYVHALEWALTNPIDELVKRRKPVTPKAHEKIQQKFIEALATVEGVELARQDAEKLLIAATADLIVAQGGESVCIDGEYYDATYSYERIHLKRRDFGEDEAEAEAPEPANDSGTRKAKKRSRKGAVSKRRRVA